MSAESSRPSKETNSVTSEFEGKGDREEHAFERVAEFIEAYPELSETPLSRTHGRKLRRIVTSAEWRDEWVEPETPDEKAFQVSQLSRRESVTWADALEAFLLAHVQYDGLRARFANGDGDSFEVPLTDAWGEEYSKKQYARAKALQRQMAGGERPTGGEAVAAWGSPATAMLTLTGSSVPDGERLGPVDHTDGLHDSFSYNGVRDTLRNTMEYHLGLDADSWGYWLQTEPHGVGVAASGENAGANACYTHLHVGVYFDTAALPAALGDDLHQIGVEFERVIDKHVEVCDFATFDAHDYTGTDDYVEESDGCISVNADVSNMGTYLAAYMGGYTEDLLEKPIEYLAWGAIYWSAARRRTSRSKVLTEAIAADACEQRAENPNIGQTASHGESVVWDDGRGPDVVCSCCGSGWAINQSLPEEPVQDDVLDDSAVQEAKTETVETLADRWPSADAAFSCGETPTETRIRSRISEYVETYSGTPSIPQLLGELSLAPRYAELATEVIAGETTPSSESFARTAAEELWELDAIIDADGEEHEPGGGGVDMAPLHLPVRHLLQETRLRYKLKSGEKLRCSKCRFSTYQRETMAHHLVGHGLDRADAADSILRVETFHGGTRPCLKHPQSEP